MYQGNREMLSLSPSHSLSLSFSLFLILSLAHSLTLPLSLSLLLSVEKKDHTIAADWEMEEDLESEKSINCTSGQILNFKVCKKKIV